MQFGYCSGSIQLDIKFDLEKYPNAESNWKNSSDRKIALFGKNVHINHAVSLSFDHF
jgi:hypothetical protein